MKTACTPKPVEIRERMEWVVAEWSHENCGGESLVFNLDPARPTFSICLGPTPWGAGSWGPFPVSAIRSVRPLRATDKWAVNGCSGESWTPTDQLHAYERVTEGFAWETERNQALRCAIQRAEGAA